MVTLKSARKGENGKALSKLVTLTVSIEADQIEMHSLIIQGNDSLHIDANLMKTVNM